jgi:pyruvate dehydrogenase E2 component (dihydrolipoamide acetyltransferase)
MTVIAMPVLADGMIEGTLVSWLVEDGAVVDVGQELAEIETDKATVVYAAEVAGHVRQLIDAGTTVPIDTPIAEVVLAHAPPAADSPSVAPLVRATGSSSETDHTRLSTLSNRPTLIASPDRVRASPLARRIAADHGIDISSVSGSGPRGRVVRDDVLHAIAPAASTPTELRAPSEARHQTFRRLALTFSQQTVAKRMSESKLAPEFHLTARVDMTEALALRVQLRNGGVDDPLPSINDLIVKAVALALLDHPRANARYVDGALEISDAVNIGIAVAVAEELLVPVVSAANTKSLRTLARETGDLALRARSGQLTPADMSGGTFTVSNLGMLGVETFEAILNPPQVAILGVGSVIDTVVPRDGEIVVRPLMSLTLVCDHRALYGASAAALLNEIRTNLESPVRLLV